MAQKLKPLLKQFGDLRPSDFTAHPVWIQCHVVDYDEPWYEETDEETFRPWTGTLPVNPKQAMFLVRATLTLADRTEYSGFLTPQPKGEPFNLGTIQPQLFSLSGERFSFWHGIMEPSVKDRRRFYRSLGKAPRKVFPIHFVADKTLARGQVSGSVPGFLWLKETVEISI